MSFIYSFNPFTGNLDKVVDEPALLDFISETYVPYSGADKAVNLNNQVLSGINGVGNSLVVFSTVAGALTTTPITTGPGVFWNRSVATPALLTPIEVTDELQVMGRSGFGIAPLPHIGVGITSFYDGAEAPSALKVVGSFLPTAPSTKGFSAIGGNATIETSSVNIQGVKANDGFDAGLNGLAFACFIGGGAIISTVSDMAGMAICGLTSFSATTTIENLWGIYCKPFTQIFGAVINVTNMFGQEIRDSDASFGAGVITNLYGLMIRQPTQGTNNYQLFLDGTDGGTGIFFGGVGGSLQTRMYQFNAFGSAFIIDTAHGGTSQDITIACGAGQTLRLNSVVYDDQQVNLANQRWSGVNDPAYVAYKSSYVVAFNPTGTGTVNFSLQFTHKIRTGSTATFHIHTVTPTTPGVNDQVRWQLTMCYSAINGTFGTPVTTLATQTLLAVGDHEIFVFTVPITTSAILSGVTLCSLTRLGADGADTYTDNIYVLSADAHIEIDTIGSRGLGTK